MDRAMAVAMDLEGWVPIRLFWREDRPWLDWCQLGDRRLTEPFFDHAIENCFRDPYCLLFRRETPVDALADLAIPAAEPSGFIFHMSRCGSTLLAQMLATLPYGNVVSEASLIDALLRAPVPEQQRITWLRGIVMALGRPPRTSGQPYFVKFAGWNTLFLPLIQRAFPTVPWVFLYREPVEVLVSLARNPGRLVPGAMDSAVLGLEPATVSAIPIEEYHARVLKRICDMAIQSRRSGSSLFINYRELPDSAWTLLPDFYGFACSDVELDAMRERARFGGKDPGALFQTDSPEKQTVATTAQRDAADRWLHSCFEQMERVSRL